MSPITAISKRRIIKWGSIGQNVLAQEEKRRENDFRQEKAARFCEDDMTDAATSNKYTGRMKLDSMEGAFRYFFQHNELKLNMMQDRLIRTIKIAFLKNMFTDDLVSNLTYLCEKFLIEELYDTVAVTVPRRVCFLFFILS